MSLLHLTGVTKRYGGVAVLSDIDLSIEPGEVVGLIGENGAGKSTLIKVVAGAVAADAGEIRIDEEPVTFAGPADAIEAGIAVIYQELSLCPTLNATENILLGSLPCRGPFVDWRAARAEAGRWLHDLAPGLSLDVPANELSVGSRQLIEIARALARRSRLIFMDEPTASLSELETERLFGVVRDLRARGVSVVFVTHRLEEVLTIADRIVVLRDGRKVGELDAASATRDDLIRLMVGRTLGHDGVPPPVPDVADVVLEGRDLGRSGRFSGVSFRVRRGEVLGLAGLVGAGRSSLLRAIFGAEPIESGTLLLDGRPVRIRSPREAIDLGIFLVPEDRARQGLVGSMSVAENIAIASWPRLGRLGFIPDGEVEHLANEQVRERHIRLRTIHQRVLSLSGGNQQKVVLGRWLALRPRVLLLDEPTRGIDVGAKAEVYQLIRDLASNGVAILLSTSELPELLALANRSLVLRDGVAVGELPAGASQEQVLHLATGGPVATLEPGRRG
ncbi:MAG: sugar ABC transporter ATP-binding protein [Chloroflexota bacterium]